MSTQMDRPRLKIAVLSALNVQDRRSWSGTFYSIAQALQKHCGDVTFLGPLDASREMLPGKVQHMITRLLFKKKVAFRHSHVVSRKYARLVAQRLKQESFDVIFSLSGATEIAFLQTNIPIVLIEDATFAALREYHPHFSTLLSSSIYQMNNLQARGIQKAALMVYSTQWAAHSALEYYAAEWNRMRVIPFGANMEQLPTREQALQHSLLEKRCRLLFVGVDWKRKGADLALETLIELERMGVDAELTICGCTPPKGVVHPRLKLVPFLDKNDEQQRSRLVRLYAEADLFFLPTRNECFGIVFCEANAFGLPVITTDTGGVSEVVINGENGFTLPHSADGVAYAEKIASIVRDPALYAELVRKSRLRYEEHLNWDTWGLSMQQALMEILSIPSVPSTLSIEVQSSH